jgi:hypothetical protein
VPAALVHQQATNRFTQVVTLQFFHLSLLPAAAKVVVFNRVTRPVLAAVQAAVVVF